MRKRIASVHQSQKYEREKRWGRNNIRPDASILKAKCVRTRLDSTVRFTLDQKIEELISSTQIP